MEERSAVNRVVIGSNPIISRMRSVAQLVGQCKNLMRTVKETKNLCHALTAINLVKKILKKFLNGSNP